MLHTSNIVVPPLFLQMVDDENRKAASKRKLLENHRLHCTLLLLQECLFQTAPKITLISFLRNDAQGPEAYEKDVPTPAHR